MAAVNLDRQVGNENFPDVPEPDPKVFIKFAVQVGLSWRKAYEQAQNQLFLMGKAIAESQKQVQSDFVLWPPVTNQLQHMAKKSKSDNRVPPRHPVFHSRPDFNRKEAIRNARTKQLSRPIGSQGCGFVWNRGRLSP